MQLKIYQLPYLSSAPYKFLGYDFAEEHGFNLEDYVCVWEENIDSDTSLEEIFTRFNVENPINFEGHSLSVSDIVELDGNKYYCDQMSWVKL